MNKDVIYIDVEDDITAIIGKVKDAQQKIVALVPPKRIGVLQSAVNLHLLNRTAKQNNKQLVLISNNSALMALASAAKIPIAKNLQSKPELASIAALDVDDGEDVIDGAQLPVGELAKTADTIPVTAGVPLENPVIDEAVRENAAEVPARAVPPPPGQPLRKPRPKGGAKVPNFNKFRKKLVFIIAGIVLLIAFLIWAIFFASHAKIIITARTADEPANTQVTLSEGASTDLKDGTIKASTMEIKKDASVSFDATGTKETGTKAKGQVVFKNCETLSEQTIPAGTAVSASGMSYITQETASVPGGTGGFGGCSSPGESNPVTVRAQDIGDEYNTPSGTSFNVSGHSNNSTVLYFRAVASSDISGGDKREIKVVTADDVEKAKQKLTDQNGDDVKKQLTDQFDDTVTVLDDTFEANSSDVVSEPAVGQESRDGNAKLTSNVTYSLTGVEKAETNRFLDAYFAQKLESEKDRRVYDNGADKVTFKGITKNDNGYSAQLLATAQIGPKIDDDAIKSSAKGKRYGEIQTSIESVEGVDDVDVKFSPFWVSKAPNDTKRISIEFKLDESK